MSDLLIHKKLKLNEDESSSFLGRVDRVHPPEPENTPPSTPNEIVFGIFSSMKSTSPTDLICCSENDTLHSFAAIICDKIFPKIRPMDWGGNGVNEHLWNFKFGKETAKEYGSSAGDYEISPEDQAINEELKLNDLPPKIEFTPGLKVYFEYDLGTTTDVYLKVLKQLPIQTHLLTTSDKKLIAKEGINHPRKKFDEDEYHPFIITQEIAQLELYRELMLPFSKENVEAVGKGKLLNPFIIFSSY